MGAFGPAAGMKKPQLQGWDQHRAPWPRHCHLWIWWWGFHHGSGHGVLWKWLFSQCGRVLAARSLRQESVQQENVAGHLELCLLCVGLAEEEERGCSLWEGKEKLQNREGQFMVFSCFSQYTGYIYIYIILYNNIYIYNITGYNLLLMKLQVWLVKAIVLIWEIPREHLNCLHVPYWLRHKQWEKQPSMRLNTG